MDNKSLVIAIVNIVVIGDCGVLFVVIQTNVNIFTFMDSQMKVKYKTQLLK